MFLRCHERKKDGKLHRYWSIVESRRVAGGPPVQRRVLYLGEISDSQEAAWRKSVEVFDEDAGHSEQVCLFASDTPDTLDKLIADDQADALSLRLAEMRLLRPRSFGDCWLGCVLWEELGLGAFWDARLGGGDPADRAGVPWSKVLAVLAVNRLCDPMSEFAVHRRWFLASAMDELLGVDFAAAAKDRLYRCLDRILPHKRELFQFLAGRWKTLFDADFDVLLYDLTSTYFEGGCAGIPKARHGYSRDGRSDCRQVVVALVVTARGLPLAYEVLAGNTSDKTTLAGFLAEIESMYGRARRVWVMDRGVPTEATLEQMRRDGVAYLVGTPKALLGKLEKEMLDKPWEQVHPGHEGMKVKLLEKDGELYVRAHSERRQKKEAAMRRRRLKKLVHGLNRLKRRPPTRDRLLKRVAVLQKEAGRVKSFVRVREPRPDEPVNRQTFVCTFDRAAWKASLERDGSYILRASIPWDAPEELPAGMEKRAPVLWQWYMQLVHVEEAFKALKGDLGLRPIHHRTQSRVEAHVLVAFLGYCLSVTLRMKLRGSAGGLTPRAVLQSMSAIQMLEVHIPTTDGRVLVLPRHTEPEAEQQMILEHLGLELPRQPPPRIRQAQVPEHAPQRPQLPDAQDRQDRQA